ncbi:hypothetical protein BDZ89DRAFT_70428 [Hymenopellis radicata]|nr:hypothetical protein BDZ89DRAFT_70428 [Hymenopellis radicata]
MDSSLCSTDKPDTSTADTANLSWKLALVLQGRARPELLETYTEERRPVVHRLKQPSRASETTINYRWSSIVFDDRVKLTDTENLKRNACIGYGEDLTAGDRAPDASGLVIHKGRQKTSLFDLLSPSEHTVLVFHADPGSVQSIVQLTTRRLSGIAQVVCIRNATSGTLPDGVVEAVDSEGLASRVYGAREDELTVMVIRPDGFIGASVHTVAGVVEYFSRIFVV